MPKPTQRERELRAILSESMADVPPFLTRRETAELLRCNISTVSIMVTRGELQGAKRIAGKPGSPLLIPKAAVLRHLERIAL